MKKNKRPPSAATPTPPAVAPRPLIGKTGLKLIGAGLLLLVVGYIVLSFADAKAQNLAGKVSPFLILGGYALVGLGLFKNRE